MIIKTDEIMRFLLLLLLTTSLIGVSVKAQNLNVMTYNLRGDNATDTGNLWEDRKLMVVTQLNKYKPDVIAFEETLASMAGYLRDTLTRYDTLGFVPNLYVGLMYNTQRLTLQTRGSFYLSATPDVPSVGWDAKFARMCIWAKFMDQLTGQSFYAFATHFDHVGTVARTNSVTLILQKINDIAGTTPTLFMGDLNTSQYDANYITLNNSTLLKDTKNLAVIDDEKERGTGNGFDINRRDRTIVDHIFATNTWKTYRHDVALDLFNGHTASDHYAVVATVGQKANNLGDLYRQFPEDFENPNPVKTSYVSGDVAFRTGSWTLNNAIIGGSSANDKPTSGIYGVRLINNNTVSAYLQMNFDVTEGVSRVTFQHSTYATDSTSKWQLEYSTNQGLTWAPAGPVISTHQLNKQQASFIMDIPGNVRFRINKLGTGATNNGRLDIDDFTIYKRKNSGVPQKTVPLIAWQFGSPASTGAEASANSNVNHQAMNVSTLSRGAGLRTVNGSSSTISLPGGFAAASSVASTLYASDTTVAINNNLYFQFVVNPKSGQKVSLSTIDARLMATGSTLKLWYWKYSLDGINFKYLAKSYLFKAVPPTSQATIDLSPYPDLQHLGSDKKVYFRLYVNGMDNSSDMVGIGVSNSGTTNDYALSVGGVVEESDSTRRIAAWQFFSPTAAGNEVAKSASLADEAVTVQPLSRGAGLTQTNSNYATPVALTRTFVAVTATSSGATVSDTTTAIANNMYFAYSLKVKPDRKISLSSLDYKVRTTTGGAKVWYWKYSLDSITFKKIAEPVLLPGATNNEGDQQPQLDLARIPELQNIAAGKTVYFRLYTNGSNTTTGTTAIGRSGTADEYGISVNGTSKSVPTSSPLAAWQFATPLRTGGETIAAASLLDSALSGGVLQRGAGLRGTDTTGTPYVLHRTFVSLTSAATTTAITDTARAVAQDMYYTFSLAVKPGYKVSLSDLNYKLRVTTGGARVFYWKYSLDGTNFEKIANPRVIPGATADEGDTQPAIDLSGIRALQDIAAGKTVYIRMYTNGSNTTSGTTAFGRSATSTTTDYVLTVGGNTTPVAAPVKLVAWQLATPATAGNETSVAATTVSSAVTATSLVRGAGLNPTGLARSFASLTGTPSSPDVTDTVTAVANNMYFGFSLTAQTGYKISLSGLDFKIRATGGGAKVYYWKYSLNGTDFYKTDDPFTLAIAVNSEGEFMPHVDLSKVTRLQNLPGGTTVTFRLYTNGSNTTTGGTAIGRSTASTTEDILWVSGSSETESALLMFSKSTLDEPVKTQITQFSAKLNHKQVELNWRALNEMPNSNFDILRADNGGHPRVLGQLKTDTTGGTLQKHSFIDFNPISGNNSYQIKTVSRDENTIYSEKAEVTYKVGNNDLLLSGRDNVLTVCIISDTDCSGEFYFRDIMGAILLKRQLHINKGKNIFTQTVNLRPGIFTGTVVFSGLEMITKKIPF